MVLCIPGRCSTNQATEATQLVEFKSHITHTNPLHLTTDTPYTCTHIECSHLPPPTSIEEVLDHLEVALVAGQSEGTLLELIGVSVDVSSILQ